MDNKSIWHQNVSTNPRAKIIVLIALGLIFVGLAILIWANQTGRISLWAASTVPATPGLALAQDCSLSGSNKKITLNYYTNGATKYNLKLNNSTPIPIGQSPYIFTTEKDSVVSYKVQACNASNQCSAYSVTKSSTACSGSTPTTTPTTTQCTSGQKKCDNLNYYGGTPCTCTTSGVWSCSKSPCGLTDSNKKCDATTGTCVTSTTPTSTPTGGCSPVGLKKCVGNVAHLCASNGTWATTSCPPNTTCQGAGECVSTLPTTTPTIAPTNIPVSDCTQGWYGCVGDDVYACDAYKVTPGDVNSAIYWKKTYRISCSDYGDGTECRKTYCGITPTASPTSTITTAEPTPTATSTETVTPTSTSTTTSSPSPTVTASPTPTIEPVAIPTSPQDFSAEAIDKDTINLSWLAPLSPELSGYKLYSVNDSGALNAIDQFAPSNLSYEIKGLLCGTTYKYALSANNVSGESDKVYTETTTGACDVVEESGIQDQKVGGLTGVYQNGGMITLTWGSVSGATGYSVYDCNGNQLTSTTNTSVVLTGLERDKDYCFYVIAHDNGGNLSQKSDEVTVNTTDYKVDEDPKVVSPGITSLVSTGASLWFNILIALLLTIGIGYFMFRNKIHSE